MASGNAAYRAGLKKIQRGPRRKRLSLIAIGNDVHRDWATLINAVAARTDWDLVIISKTCDQRLAESMANVTIRVIDNTADLIRLYQQADLAIVPLTANLHASGITVMLEAAIAGLPMVATDVGGLKAYFDDRQVRYVPPADAGHLRGAIADLAADPHGRMAMATWAQARIGHQGLSSESYVQRHVDLSRLLLMGDVSPADLALPPNDLPATTTDPASPTDFEHVTDLTRRRADTAVAR